MKMRGASYLKGLLFLFLSLELLSRIQHFAAYGLLMPIHQGVLHYSKSSLELAKSNNSYHPPRLPPNLVNGRELWILAGGSTAAGYGVQPGHFSMLLQNDQPETQIMDLSHPGDNIGIAISRLSDLKEPQNYTGKVIFLGGYNEAAMIHIFESNLRTIRSTLLYRMGLRFSVLFHKLSMRWHYTRNPRTKENWSKLLKSWLDSLQKLGKSWGKFEIYFVFQPLLDSNNSNESNLDLSSVQNKEFQSRKQDLKKALSSVMEIKFLDGETILNQETDSQFLDVCHLNSRGYLNLKNWLLEELNKSAN